MLFLNPRASLMLLGVLVFVLLFLSLEDSPPTTLNKWKAAWDKQIFLLLLLLLNCWRRKYWGRGEAEALISVTGFSHSLQLLSVAQMDLAFIEFMKLGQYRKRTSLLKRSYLRVSGEQGLLRNPYQFSQENEQVNINKVTYPHKKKTQQTNNCKFQSFQMNSFAFGILKILSFPHCAVLFTCPHKQKALCITILPWVERALTQSHRTSFDLNWPFKHNSIASEDLAYPSSDCAGWDL